MTVCKQHKSGPKMTNGISVTQSHEKLHILSFTTPAFLSANLNPQAIGKKTT